jgi:copper chaperone CopZ
MLTLGIPAISCGHCARADSAAVRERLAEEGYPPSPQ